MSMKKIHELLEKDPNLRVALMNEFQFKEPLLKNKNIFITGGTSELGRSTVVELIKEGANVAFTYFKSEHAAQDIIAEARSINQSAKIICYKLDLRSTDQVKTVVREVLNDYGAIQGVVNNAGDYVTGFAHLMEDDEWDEYVDVNLTGTFRVCREFLKVFVGKRQEARFVNISSLSYVGGAGLSCYSATKAGVIGFTKSLAKEYGSRRIYSNAVVPGLFDKGLPANVLKTGVRATSLKRLGKPNECADAVVFLLSDRASFVNGSVFHVTGGLDAVPIA